jgi:hypothetical protein
MKWKITLVFLLLLALALLYSHYGADSGKPGGEQGDKQAKSSDGSGVGDRTPVNTPAFPITVKVFGQPETESLEAGQTGEMVIKSGRTIELESSGKASWIMMDQNSNTSNIMGENNTVRFGGISLKVSATPSSWKALVSVDDPGTPLPYLLTVTAKSVADPSQRAVLKVKVTGDAGPAGLQWRKGPTPANLK